MNKCADSIRVVHPLFQAEGGGAIPTSALQLCLDGIDIRTARALNRLWHSRLPRLGNDVSMKAALCFGAEFDERYYAVAVWTHPIARNLPQDNWLELRRLAIAPDAPRNTASRMLGVMARLIRKARPEIERLVSYQDTEVHTGGIYKAAGWVPSVVSPGGEWSVPSRQRQPAQSAAPKQRWEKVIRDEVPA